MYVWLFILFLFCILVFVGIKYDQIVPRFMGLVKEKKINIWYLVLGFLFFLVSFIALSEKSEFQNFTPGIHRSDRWGFPVHTRLWFAVSFICGVISVISAFVVSKKGNLKKSDNDFRKICISCGKVLKEDSIGSSSCPKCGGTVEDIRGVTERHPDFLNNSKKSL